MDGAEACLVSAMVVFYFMVFPTANSGARLFPSGQFVLRPGQNATLHCFPPPPENPPAADRTDVYTYQWYFNDEIVTTANYRNILMDSADNAGGIGTLTITDISLEHHMVKVRCAVLLNGTVVASLSDTTTINLFQGHIPLIVFLQANTSESLILLNWATPVLSRTDNVTSYCVDVVSGTSSLTIHAECGITKTMFSYPIPSDIACTIYYFTVIAVNDSGSNVSRYCQSYPDEISGPYAIWRNHTWVLSNDTNMDRVLRITVMMSAPVCTTDEVACIETDTGSNMRISINSTILNDTAMIEFTLQSNRHCCVTITATNTGGPETSEAFCISTYDVSSVSVEQRGSVVDIMTNYTEHSNAIGVLINFASINESITEADLARFECLILDRNSSYNYTLPFELTAGKYRASAYDIEMDGTLAIGTIYPAAQNEITIQPNTTGNSIDSPRTGSIDCNISANDNTITAKCNSSDFQMIARQSEIQRDFLYVNQSTNMEMESSEATCTIEVEDEGKYQVFILPIVPGQGIVTPDNNRCMPYEMLEISLSTETTQATLMTDDVNPVVIAVLVVYAVVMVLVQTCWCIYKRRRTIKKRIYDCGKTVKEMTYLRS